MYISLDIETGGLDKDMDILQIAAVAWNRPEIMDCSFIDIIINQDDLLVEPYAARMNMDLIGIMADGTDERLADDYDGAFELFGAWLEGVCNGEKAFCLGKNVSTFDLPFLKEKGFDWENYFKHRVLDAGALFADENGIPSLPEIIQIVGNPPFVGQLHDALYDARATLWIVQQALKGVRVI